MRTDEVIFHPHRIFCAGDVLAELDEKFRPTSKPATNDGVFFQPRRVSCALDMLRELDKEWAASHPAPTEATTSDGAAVPTGYKNYCAALTNRPARPAVANDADGHVGREAYILHLTRPAR
jgi:hypothetical protein